MQARQSSRTNATSAMSILVMIFPDDHGNPRAPHRRKGLLFRSLGNPCRPVLVFFRRLHAAVVRLQVLLVVFRERQLCGSGSDVIIWRCDVRADVEGRNVTVTVS